jgi:hypothetical protein
MPHHTRNFWGCLVVFATRRYPFTYPSFIFRVPRVKVLNMRVSQWVFLWSFAKFNRSPLCLPVSSGFLTEKLNLNWAFFEIFCRIRSESSIKLMWVIFSFKMFFVLHYLDSMIGDSWESTYRMCGACRFVWFKTSYLFRDCRLSLFELWVLDSKVVM